MNYQPLNRDICCVRAWAYLHLPYIYPERKKNHERNTKDYFFSQ